MQYNIAIITTIARCGHTNNTHVRYNNRLKWNLFSCRNNIIYRRTYKLYVIFVTRSRLLRRGTRRKYFNITRGTYKKISLFTHTHSFHIILPRICLVSELTAAAHRRPNLKVYRPLFLRSMHRRRHLIDRGRSGSSISPRQTSAVLYIYIVYIRRGRMIYTPYTFINTIL